MPKKRLTTLLTINLFAIAAIQADQSPTPKALADEKGHPWFTGPLLSPSPHVEAPGRINFQPYMFMTQDVAYFNNKWQLQADQDNSEFQINWNTIIQIGIIKDMSIQLAPQTFYTENKGSSGYELGDFDVELQYLVYHTKSPEDPIPDIRIAISEDFPTGNYQNLDPARNATDIGGSGSYATNFTLSIGKLYHIEDWNYINTRAALIYSWHSDVNVNNSNTYGGTQGTSGTVSPGQVVQGYIGIEYSLTHNWVIAMDIAGVYSSNSTFSGNSAGASVGSPSSWIFSIAPAIEYNVSETLGVIAGVWVPFAGENSTDFVSGIISLVYNTDFEFMY